MTIRPHGLKSGHWKRLALLASSCFLLPLLMPSFGLLRYGVLYFLFAGILLCGEAFPLLSSFGSRRSRGETLLVSLLLILIFFVHWNEWFALHVSGSSWLSYLLTGIVALVFLAGASPFLSSLLHRMMNAPDQSDASHSSAMHINLPLSRRDIVVSILMALLVMTFCCCFSPLYSTNTWCSPACYHTVGKSLWSGLLPYRDLYEHKGPLVYALYSLATLISYKSFLGMYLLSLPFAFFFFYFSRKALHVLVNRSIDPWFAIVGIGIYCATCYFCGGSVEELLLPFLAYALYVGVICLGGRNADNVVFQAGADATRRVPTNRQSFFLGLGVAECLGGRNADKAVSQSGADATRRVPTNRQSFFLGLGAAECLCGRNADKAVSQSGADATRRVPTSRQSFFLGLGVAVVLWTKFNILAFYFAYGLFFIFYSIRHHQVRDFLRALLPAFFGFLSVTLPVVIFYVFNGALGDLFQVYFHDNLFLYMDAGDMMAVEQVDGPIGQLATIVGLNVRDNALFFLVILLAALWLGRKNAALSWLYVLTFAFTALFIFIKPDYYKYYCFILAVFVPYCVLPLSALAWPAGKGKMLFLKGAVVVLAVVLVLTGSDNLWKMKLQKDDYIQFRFARTIMKEPSPTLLNYYCQDQGVFAVTGIVPTNRFYCDFNNSLSDVHQEQDSIVSCRGVQFVVSMIKFNFDGYDVVDQAVCPVKGVTFYLYKRKE